MGHFLGGMFCFQGEWYWGVDRLRLLESRLIEEGFNRDDGGIRVPEPIPAETTGLQAAHIKLEYFPSLRSPYTAIGHERVLALIDRSGVSVEVRPVMPMLMRGVTAPRAKQRYIITDASREGWAHNSPMGRIVDPFGEPVKRAFALYPGAMAMGKSMAFVSAYLQAAWVDGVDVAEEPGLRQVAQRAGIDWGELNAACEGSDWEAILDANLNDMLDAGLWGVPSFRISGGNSDSAFACWGQDRLWRVENEIYQRCAAAEGPVN
jgi:2-hydroxychromene-2-carboxylate isomerase